VKLKENLCVSKEAMSKFDMGRFNVKKQKSKNSIRLKNSNRFVALENFDDDDDDDVDISRA
jgi:hypothetical protein